MRAFVTASAVIARVRGEVAMAGWEIGEWEMERRTKVAEAVSHVWICAARSVCVPG